MEIFLIWRLNLTLNQKVVNLIYFHIIHNYYILGDLCTNWREHDSLPDNCKMRAVEQPNGKTSFQSNRWKEKSFM